MLIPSAPFFLSERNVLCDANEPRTVWEHLLQLAAINQSVKWNPVMTVVKNTAPIVIKPIYISQDFSNCSRNGTHSGMFTLSILSTGGGKQENIQEANYC